jgi:hypothetical protein
MRSALREHWVIVPAFIGSHAPDPACRGRPSASAWSSAATPDIQAVQELIGLLHDAVEVFEAGRCQ